MSATPTRQRNSNSPTSTLSLPPLGPRWRGKGTTVRSQTGEDSISYCKHFSPLSPPSALSLLHTNIKTKTLRWAQSDVTWCRITDPRRTVWIVFQSGEVFWKQCEDQITPQSFTLAMDIWTIMDNEQFISPDVINIKLIYIFCYTNHQSLTNQRISISPSLLLTPPTPSFCSL